MRDWMARISQFRRCPLSEYLIRCDTDRPALPSCSRIAGFSSVQMSCVICSSLDGRHDEYRVQQGIDKHADGSAGAK